MGHKKVDSLLPRPVLVSFLSLTHIRYYPTLQSLVALSPLTYTTPQTTFTNRNIKMYAKAFIAALAGSAVVAAAHNETVVTTTEVVSKYTTYCPGPTHVTMGNKTYTVTEATTLTIVDCPCTIVKVSISLTNISNI